MAPSSGFTVRVKLLFSQIRKSRMGKGPARGRQSIDGIFFSLSMLHRIIAISHGFENALHRSISILRSQPANIIDTVIYTACLTFQPAPFLLEISPRLLLPPS